MQINLLKCEIVESRCLSSAVGTLFHSNYLISTPLTVPRFAVFFCVGIMTFSQSSGN